MIGEGSDGSNWTALAGAELGSTGTPMMGEGSTGTAADGGAGAGCAEARLRVPGGHSAQAMRTGRASRRKPMATVSHERAEHASLKTAGRPPGRRGGHVGSTTGISSERPTTRRKARLRGHAIASITWVWVAALAAARSGAGWYASGESACAAATAGGARRVPGRRDRTRQPALGNATLGTDHRPRLSSAPSQRSRSPAHRGSSL